MKFNGHSYNAAKDYSRLAGQLRTIFEIMKDGVWRTTKEIADILGSPNLSSVEANLRNLRKPENGGHQILRKNRKGIRGWSEYRLMLYREEMPKPVEEKTPEQYRDEVRERMTDFFK